MTDKKKLDDLTVFFITVTGRETAQAAWDSLMEQDSDFSVEVIKDVTPISRALQLPLELCETKFFAYVDDDMLLRPHAIRTAYERILKGDEPALVVYPMWDVHMGRAFYNFRMHRYQTAVEHYTKDTVMGDMDLSNNLVDAGETVVTEGNYGGLTGNVTIDDPNVLGLHGTIYTDKTAFFRYEKVMRVERDQGGSGFIYPLLADLMKRLGIEDFQDNPDLWGLLGVISGLTLPEDALRRDFSSLTVTPEYAELAAHIVGEPTILDVYLGSSGSHCRETARKALGLFPTIQEVRWILDPEEDMSPEPDSSRGCLVPFTHLGLGPGGTLTGCVRAELPRKDLGELAFGHDCWSAMPGPRRLRRELTGALALSETCRTCLKRAKHGGER